MDKLTAAAGGTSPFVASLILSALGGAIVYIGVLVLVAHLYPI